MQYCKKCGLELDADALFCHSCGTPVVKTKKSEKEITPVKYGDKNLGGTILNTKQTYGIIDLERLPEDYEIDNRYKVIKKLGQGSFGAVYKVYDQKLEIEKALKIIPEAISNDKEAMNSLRKEASIMAKLNHPSIVRVYDFHYRGDIKYIDMEYVEGESLAEIKLEKPDKRFSEEEVKKYAIQILEGLSYAHKKKVIHKDIKPQNIMLDESGMIRIMDFGIAESVHSSMSRLKNTGSSGTLVYMSPEQLRGKDVGKEADIYSLGATLYELLSGNPPFYQGDITYQIINEKPGEIKGISERMNIIIQKCLKKEMEERYSDCESFRKALINGIKPQSKHWTQNSDVSIGESFISFSSSEAEREGGLNKEKVEDEIKAEDPQEAKIKTIANNYAGEMIFVKGGCFNMGSNSGDNDEKPIHEVCVDDFYIGKYEVTQYQWKEIMGHNPSHFKLDDRPVENVSWNDVQEFIKELNKKTGQNYRLPTETEWEYAARGGNKSKEYIYSGSNNINDVAWYTKNSDSKTHKVGIKQANELGIYDMSGNVWEWCNDWYKRKYYKSSPRNSPHGPPYGNRRVLRGGSWNDVANNCRVTYRLRDTPVNTSINVGFRLVVC